MWVSPSPIAAIRAARWEIDLSEGGRRTPRRGPEGSKRELLMRRPYPRTTGDYAPGGSTTVTVWPSRRTRSSAFAACSSPATQTETAPEVMSGAG